MKVLKIRFSWCGVLQYYRLAHPGGALATNKAAALAKFLKRKLEEPGGAATLNPSLVERAVQNAKITTRSGTQTQRFYISTSLFSLSTLS